MQPSFLKITARPISFLLIIAMLFGNAGLAYAALPENAKVSYYLYDHLGGVDKMLDDKGNVVCSNDYLPYGDIRRGDCTENSENYGFTGKEKDPETDLMYYGARYYDSVTGRFISVDPQLLDLNTMDPVEFSKFLEDPQNLNAYTYAKNNPLKYVDPDGEAAITALIVATAFIATFMSGYQNVAAPDIGSPSIHTRSEAEIIGSMTAGEILGGAIGYVAGKAISKVVGFGFKTVGQLRAYRQMVNEGVRGKISAKQVMESAGANVKKVSKQIEKYLGQGAHGRTNESGDLILQSEDQLKDVRFDFKNPSPHKNPHVHTTEYKEGLRGKVKQSEGKAFPKDTKSE